MRVIIFIFFLVFVNSCMVEISKKNHDEVALKTNFEYIVFESGDSNLMQGDYNRNADVILYEVKSKKKKLLKFPDNLPKNTYYHNRDPFFSSNRKYIGFTRTVFHDSFPTGCRRDFVRYEIASDDYKILFTTNNKGKMTEILTAKLTDNGENLIFSSSIGSLIPSDVNNSFDIFIKNIETNFYKRISENENQEGGINPERPAHIVSAFPAVTPDGSRVVFASNAINLIPTVDSGDWQIYLWEKSTGSLTLVSSKPSGELVNAASWKPSISKDGNYVAFSSSPSSITQFDFLDNNKLYWLDMGEQLFLKDLVNNNIERISVASDGEPAICGNSNSPKLGNLESSRYVIFTSTSRKLIDPNAECISLPKRYVFLRDRIAKITKCISCKYKNEPIKGECRNYNFSKDEKEISFHCRGSYSDRYTDELYIYKIETEKLYKVM